MMSTRSRGRSRTPKKGNNAAIPGAGDTIETKKNNDVEGPKQVIIVESRHGENADTAAEFRLSKGRKMDLDRILAKELQMMFFPKFRYETKNFGSTRVVSGDGATVGNTGSGKAGYFEMYFNPVSHQETMRSFAGNNLTVQVNNAGLNNWTNNNAARDQLIVTHNVAMAEWTNPTDRIQNLYYCVFRARDDHNKSVISLWDENIARRSAGTGGGTVPDPRNSVYEWQVCGPAVSKLWDCVQSWVKVCIYPGQTHKITLNFGKAWYGERSSFADNDDETYSRNTFVLCGKVVGQNVINADVGSSSMTTATASLVYHARQETEFYLYRQHQQRMTRWMADNQLNQGLTYAQQATEDPVSGQGDPVMEDLAN